MAPSVKKTSTSRKRKHEKIAPAQPPSKYTSYELFGTDSEDEGDDHEIKPRPLGNNSNQMFSYFTIKYPKAYSRQVHKDKVGEYYIELKIHNLNKSELITKRPRADITIKNRTDCSTEAWFHLKKFIEVCRRQTKQCTMFSIFNEERPLI